jgi:DNA-binding NtrC family response regulator
MNDNMRQRTERISDQGTPVIHTSPVNVLIVDDEQKMGQFLCLLVRELGYNAFACQSTVEARHLLSSRQWHLVVTDFHMPHENGFELLHWVKTHYPQLPIIAMTVDSSNQTSYQAHASGFATLLNKPFSIHEFYQVAGQWTNKDW